jgi:hypothetical protein
MASEKWTVSYLNDWNNTIVLFRGTESQCKEYYEDHIEVCESVDAFCCPAIDPDSEYKYNHRAVYYDAPMYYE